MPMEPSNNTLFNFALFSLHALHLSIDPLDQLPSKTGFCFEGD